MGDSNVTMGAMGMFGVPFTMDFSLEPFMFVGSVVHNPFGTVRFVQGVGTFDMVMVTLLVLMLMVVGMRVVNPIFEVVVRHLVMVVLNLVGGSLWYDLPDDGDDDGRDGDLP